MLRLVRKAIQAPSHIRRNLEISALVTDNPCNMSKAVFLVSGQGLRLRCCGFPVFGFFSLQNCWCLSTHILYLHTLTCVQLESLCYLFTSIWKLADNLCRNMYFHNILFNAPHRFHLLSWSWLCHICINYRSSCVWLFTPISTSLVSVSKKMFAYNYSC